MFRDKTFGTIAWIIIVTLGMALVLSSGGCFHA